MDKIREKWNNKHFRRFAVLADLLFLYLAGVIAQFLNNRHGWAPGRPLELPSANPLKALAMLFTPFGLQAAAGLFCFLLIIALLFFLFRQDRTGMKYDKKRNFWYSEKGVYGTAGWMGDEELKSSFALTEEEQAGEVKEIIYGVRDGMVVSKKPDSFLNDHIAVMGASGSRKSRTLARGLIISCAQKGESLVCTDPKGELAADTRMYLEDHGYDVKILNLVRPWESGRFDGLDGALENPIFVSSIVDAVISNTGGPKGDATFDDAEANLLSALIFLQFEGNKFGEYPTLKGAYWTLLRAKTVEDLTARFDDLPETSRACLAYGLFRKASPNLQGNIIIGLGVRLSILQNEGIADLMSFPDMDFLQLGQKKTAYFLILSDQDNTIRFVSAMFFSLLFLRLVQFADNECPERRLPVPVNLLLDEFCALMGSIPGFHIKISNIRSRGMKILLIFQSLGQLQNRYPDQMWSEILGNTDTIICLGCSSDPVTAKFTSDRSGEVTIYADTVMTQRSVFLPSILVPNYRHSEGAGRRKLLTPDEVMRMDDGKLLVMVRGRQMLELDKFDYTRNPQSKKFRPAPAGTAKPAPMDMPQAPPEEPPAAEEPAPPEKKKKPPVKKSKAAAQIADQMSFEAWRDIGGEVDYSRGSESGEEQENAR